MTFSSILATTVLLAATCAEAQTVRPGLDRPIRVGMFKGTGTGSRYWHTNIHTAISVMRDLLARPDTAGLGDSVVIPPAGFWFHAIPIELNSSITGECAGPGCGPNQSQIADFVLALDTIDVLVMNSVTDWGRRVTDAAHRNAFRNFWLTKGYVAIHGMTDSYGTWAPLDSIHGARLRGWPAEQNFTVRRDSAHMDDPEWKYLNKGIFSNGVDTTFFEEPIYFTEPGERIRARAHLKPTVNLVEASVVNPGSLAPMGDHPYSWYRQLPEGGRFFYTALGHRAQVWQSNRMFRRQLYNAILWAAGADSTGVVSVRGTVAGKSLMDFSEAARISTRNGMLTVSVLQDGPHAIEIAGVDGRRVAVRRGAGRVQHEFAGLRTGVYFAKVTSGTQSTSQLITVP